MSRVDRRFAIALAAIGSISCRGRGAEQPAAASPRNPVAVAVSSATLDGTRWLARDAEVARALGAGPLQIAVTQVGADGDRIGGFVDIPSDQCLLAYARGSPGIEDLDLYAYTDEGTTLAADEATDSEPAVVVCPPHPTRAYVLARVVAGRGIVTVGVHGLLPSTAAQVGHALGARGRPGEEMGRVEAWPGLDERVARHRRSIGGQWEEVRRVAVQADARAPTRLAATVEAGRCLDVFVLPGEEFAQLDVAILDADERILVRAPSVGQSRTAILCSSTKATLSVELRPHAGQGLCAVMLARSAVGDQTEISAPVHEIRQAPRGDLASEARGRGQALASAGYGRKTSIGAGTAEVGRRLSLALNAPEGCSRLDVIGGRPVAGLTADLWSAAGTLIASGASGTGPALFACGARPGVARLDIEALSRGGPFAVELREEPGADRALLTRPLAAGRLLAALQSESRAVPAAAWHEVHAVTVDTTSYRALEWVLPAKRCASIVAALDAGGTGLELRLTEPAPLPQPLATRGQFVAATHACAEEHPRTLRVELRLQQGKADALAGIVLDAPE